MDLLKLDDDSGKNPSALKICDDFGFTVTKSMIQYLKRKPTDIYIDLYLFEFFVYKKIYHEVDRGRLYCNDSVSYCDIDTDLIDDALVDDAEKIATDFGYAKIPIYCDQRLDDALQELDNAWDRTTGNILDNKNPGFRIRESKTGQQTRSLTYDRLEKLDDAFFKNLPKIEIANIMMFVGDKIKIWEGFTQIKDRYAKRKKPIPLGLNACLLSEAFGFVTLDYINVDYVPSIKNVRKAADNLYATQASDNYAGIIKAMFERIVETVYNASNDYKYRIIRHEHI